MKTKTIHLHIIRNEEHFFFHTEVRDLIAEMNPQVQDLADIYETLLEQLDEALEVIRKSALTKEVEETDLQRDNLFRGMCNFVKAMHDHFDENKVKAAARIQIVLDTYGNVAKKPYFEQTAAMFNLVQELRENYAQETAIIHLTEWVEALHTSNNQFKMLLGDRYNEQTTKTTLKVKEVRPQIDEQYKKIIQKIEALHLIDGSEIYGKFISRLNLVIDKYNNLLAQRKGKKMKNVECRM